jgi:membrane-bound lytic murein transglycosylase A
MIIENLFRYIFVISIGALLFACASQTTQSNTPKEEITPIAPNSQFKQYLAAYYYLSSWQSLPNWQNESFEQSWSAWLLSCQYFNKINNHEWQQVCRESQKINASDKKLKRDFFEKNFQVWELRQARDQKQFAKGSNQGLITGYYEPILKGSLTRKGVYQTPIYKMPPSWHGSSTRERPPRAELLKSGVLKGQEIAWVEDPVAAAFMQIQGSGKIMLENNKIMRLGFSGTNNQPFVSFAQWLINQKEITYAQASMQGISEWAKKNPSRVQEMLNANPRFVFFKVLETSSALSGPIGSIGVPLTEQRSIAVDWQAIPKGAPVYLATTDPSTSAPIEKLVFAQDTGSAIVGGVRADYFWGSGNSAGESAGKMKQVGRMWVILPKSIYP